MSKRYSKHVAWIFINLCIWMMMIAVVPHHHHHHHVCLLNDSEVVDAHRSQTLPDGNDPSCESCCITKFSPVPVHQPTFSVPQFVALAAQAMVEPIVLIHYVSVIYSKYNNPFHPRLVYRDRSGRAPPYCV